MPVHEYECPQGHVSERVTQMGKEPPHFIRCPKHEGTTHYENCARLHVCGQRAKKRQVYRVSVGGDLPTRGAF